MIFYVIHLLCVPSGRVGMAVFILFFFVLSIDSEKCGSCTLCVCVCVCDIHVHVHAVSVSVNAIE